jgi:hypothetical protein
MCLEGAIQNGVVVLDPGSPPLADGTRVEVAPRTGMEPLIRKTPGVCGGAGLCRQSPRPGLGAGGVPPPRGQ